MIKYERLNYSNETITEIVINIVEEQCYYYDVADLSLGYVVNSMEIKNVKLMESNGKERLITGIIHICIDIDIYTDSYLNSREYLESISENASYLATILIKGNNIEEIKILENKAA